MSSWKTGVAGLILACAGPCLGVGPCLGAGGAETLPGPIPARVVRVIDGDTVEVRARVWLGTEVTTRVRLRGVDAPELRGGCPGEVAAAVLARDFLDRLLDGGEVTLAEVAPDKFGGRVDARLRAPDGRAAAEVLLAAGLVRRWTGRREGWC